MKPALLVDAHSPGPSGLGRYTREMLRALAGRDDFRAIHIAGDPAEVSGWVSGATVIPFKHRRHSPWVPRDWSRVEAAVPGPRVSWFPHWDGAWTARPGVTTIHDLLSLQESGIVGAAKRAYARAWMQRMVRHSAALVTGSEHTALQVVAEFPEAAGKITAIHHGVADVFFDARPSASPMRYLLTVGNKRPHKRFETAIRAFARVAPERPELQLVMVGHRDPHASALRALAASLGVAQRIHDATALTDAELAQRYANAEAMLLTSRDEGFGLIAIEAMAAGAPVIAVDRGPFREVVGEAGILVPFDDDRAMADAIRTLDRAHYIALGRARAEAFTWARAAAELARILLAAAD